LSFTSLWSNGACPIGRIPSIAAPTPYGSRLDPRPLRGPFVDRWQFHIKMTLIIVKMTAIICVVKQVNWRLPTPGS
jgi:hypothetical protein